MIRVLAEAARSIRCAMDGNNYALRALLMISIGFLFFSCDLFIFDEEDTKSFWATNVATNKDYKVKAELLASGVYCNVWVEKGSGVNRSRAKNIADEYDNKIHLQMINAFGLENPSYNGRTFSNIMEFADSLGDGDGKLCILLLDIKDNYQKGVNDSYVAGYFWSGNFYDMSGSNYCDMIYIDTYPGMKDENIGGAFTTLAHEMQHLMNFVTSRIKRSTYMDTWIDEGLSSAAEYIINNEHSQDRIDWYNNNGDSKNDIKGIIDKGNNFFVWDNHKDEQYAILDDYATVYLFFQWLRLQKGDGVYREIISSTFSDYRAVTAATGEGWDNLLKTWMAANYINDSTGDYGYKGDISDITTHTVQAGGTQVSLYPGEGVYSLTEAGDTMPAQGVKIKYAGLDKNSEVSDNAVFAAGRLLTYNIDTALNGSAETGTTTGKAASVNTASSMGRAVKPYSGPYRIGAGDILPKNWNKNDSTSRDFQER
jgi:hypothetical protein